MSHRYTASHSLPQPARMIHLLLVAAIAAHIVFCALLATTPPVSRDALTHHLVIPKIYLRQGGLGEIPQIGASYYPQNLQLLYLLPLYFGNDIIPKYIHFAFALLTAGLIFGYLRSKTDSRYALFAVLLFLSLPVIVKLSVTVYVDLGLIFFSTASLLLLFRWMERGFQTRYLVLSAVSCGLALGTKYNALITLFLLTLFVPFTYMRRQRPAAAIQMRALGAGLLFCAVALLVFSPWMIRNARWTGNPVHPLFSGFFSHNHSTAPPTTAKAGSGQLQKRKAGPLPPKSPGHFWIRKHIFGERWWQTALIPIRIFFEGRDDDPRTFDGKLNPLLLLLPGFAFMGFRRNAHHLKVEKMLLLAYALLFLLFAYFYTDMRIRYVAPIIPPLVLLSALGLKEINARLLPHDAGWRRKTAVVALTVFIAAMLGLNVVYLREQYVKYEPIGFISGKVRRDAYISRYRPEYPALRYANLNLDKNAKILCLFQGRRRYYSEIDTVHSIELLQRTIRKSSTAEAVLDRLHGRRFTHLLINVALFQDWARDVFTDDEITRLNLFFNRYTKPLIAEGGYVLLELRSTPSEKG